MEFDDKGNLFLTYVDFNKYLYSGSVLLRKSTDGGLTWSAPVEVITTKSDSGKYPIDRPWISIDRSGGAFSRYIYITTMTPTVFGILPPPYHPYLIVSSDGGKSFNKWRYLDTLNWYAGNIIQSPMPTSCVGSDGNFYAVYPSYVYSQNPFGQFIIASSSNGGVKLLHNKIFASPHSVKDTLVKRGYLLRADPSDANHLAFFYLDVLYGDIDVFMSESFDKGITWSKGLRINDDPIGNNRMQDLLWADFDDNGNLAVSWRDRRNSSDSTYSTAYEIWGAVRLKNSSNFSPNFRISDTLVAYSPVLALSGNDFMCMKFVNDTINAVWGDTRNGKLNIWFQRIAVHDIISSVKRSSKNEFSKLSKFLLRQNYPNPFPADVGTSNPTTTIKYSIPAVGTARELSVHLAVYDVLGRKVATLVNQRQAPGNYSVQFNAANLPSGIYFYRISAGNFTAVKKMQLLK